MVPARRKQVRIQLRRDLHITEQSWEGRPHYVLKDPVSLRYFRFRPREHFLLRRLDGTHTLEDIRIAYERAFRPNRLPLETVEAFARQLVADGLAHGGSPDIGRELLERSRRQQRLRRLGTLTDLLAVRVPLFDPDRLLARLLPCLRGAFSPWSFAGGLGLVLAALLLAAAHFHEFHSRLPAAREFFSFKQVIYLWIALGVVKVIHEFGHGLSCKAFGGEVHEMGALFLCLSPCLYCNVSDAWTMPSKWRRIIISFAGIYVELVIAALATFLWWNSASHPFVNNLSLSLMVVCSVSTVVFNGNPLMRYDGYYILADWLEIPNLAERSRRFLCGLFLAHGLGMDVRGEPNLARWRQGVLAVYAAASLMYRILVTIGVLWLLHRFLKPYRLESAGTLLAVLSVAGTVGWPMARTVRDFARQRRWPEMSWGRALLTAGLAAGLLAVFFGVPLPVARIRQVGLVQVRPGALTPIFVPASGVLQRLAVREGQPVRKGDLLAEFHSPDLEERLADLRVQQDKRATRLQALQLGAHQTRDPREQARIGGELARTAGDQARSENQGELWEQLREGMGARAPQDGVVLGLPPVDAVGRLWDGQQVVCSIGDPTRIQVLVPLSPADFRLLRADRSDLSVKLRIQGRPGATWSGRVAQVPESEAWEVPVPLTRRAGGPVAVRERSNVPASQQYLVAIDIQGAGTAIYPGCMAQVVIVCRPRTAAWWAWRTLATAFELPEWLRWAE